MTEVATPETKPFEELLKEKFNLTETELSERLTKTTEYETKFPEYETRINELTQKAQLVDKYEGNAFVKTLAEVAETNPDNLKTYVELSTVDVDKIGGLDAKKLRYKLEKGWSAEDINDVIAEQYVAPDKDKYDTDEDYAKAVEAYNRKINRDSVDDKTWLAEFKTKIAYNPQSTKAKQEFEELKANAETLPQLFNNPLEWDFKVAIEDKEKFGLTDDVQLGTTFKFEVSEEQKKELHQLAKQFVVQQGIKDFSAKNLEVVENNLLLLEKGRRYDNDMPAIVNKAIKETTEKLHEFYTRKFSVGEQRTPKLNPSATGNSAPAENTKEVVWNFKEKV